MNNIQIYQHERLEIGNNILLTIVSRSDKFLVANVHSQDPVNGVGFYKMKDILGTIFAYFDEHPTMEDAQPYWSVKYIVELQDRDIKNDMMEIIDALINKNIISEPAWILNWNLAPYNEEQSFDIQRGAIFPDDD